MSSIDSNHRRICDRYVLTAPLGRGGMGAVWRAEDTVLQREVAVKEIDFPPNLTGPELDAIKARAMREARSAAGLSSPNVVTIFDVIQEPEGGFIVMEFVEAPTLADVIAREGALPPERTARIGLDILAALEAAHARDIVHRDVKPANVMIEESGRAKLADFGIASVKDDPKITATGMVLGSPQFMAPEQASGTATGPATDLWSLGATLYYAVEGEFPFDRGETIPTLAAVVHDPPRPMTSAGPLEPIITALLSKDPARRPRHVALCRDLERVAAGDRPAAVAPAPTPPPPRARPTTRVTEVRSRRGLGVVLVALALVLAAGAVAFVLTRDGDAGRPERAERSDRTEGRSGTTTSTTVVPDDWVRYRIADTGYSVAHPPDWSIEPSGDTQVDIRDPAGGRYLRVAWTDSPGPSAEGAWQDLARSFAESHENYEEIAIETTSFKDFDDAAVWEFTYTEGGADLHAVDLGFVTNDGEYGFALNFQTHAEEWASSQDLFDAFKASFRPGH